jgi:hypothetical protein
MNPQPTLVLFATVSRADGRGLEAFLKEGGFEVRGVEDALGADREVGSHGGASVLLIDSGFLLMPRDSQWRRLRARRPSLGAVVRALGGCNALVQRPEARTFLVHPDDRDGMVQAIRALEPAAGPGLGARR